MYPDEGTMPITSRDEEAVTDQTKKDETKNSKTKNGLTKDYSFARDEGGVC